MAVSAEEDLTGRIPAACTLPTAEQPRRLAEFDALFRSALQTVDRVAPTRLMLTLAAAPGRADAVRELTDREATCCSFFTFGLSGEDPILLTVSVPAGYVAVLDDVQGLATQAVPLHPPKVDER